MNFSNLTTLLSVFGEDKNGSTITMILLYAVVIGGLWFFMIRPQSKKKKQEDSMRNNLEIGDEVTTIGGIIGKIVNIKDDTDTLIIETGVDRSKIKIKRWAIASCDSENKKS